MVDSNLSFLQFCDNSDLQALCDVLTHNSKGEIRLTEQLTDSVDYHMYYPHKMRKLWKPMAIELQRYGGNTIANLFRGGQGVSYVTILKDVCRKLKVKIPKECTVEELEISLLTKYCEKVVSKLNINLLRELGEQVGLDFRDYTKPMMLAAILMAIRMEGLVVVLPVLSFIGANLSRILVSQGLYYSGTVLIGRSIGFLWGPISWALTAGWLLLDISSPAYRVTVPAVLQIASMRAAMNARVLPMN